MRDILSALGLVVLAAGIVWQANQAAILQTKLDALQTERLRMAEIAALTNGRRWEEVRDMLEIGCRPCEIVPDADAAMEPHDGEPPEAPGTRGLAPDASKPH